MVEVSGQAVAHRIFANELDPAFKRRAAALADWLAISGDQRASLSVLDVGCGRGFYFPLYAALDATRIVGVDFEVENLRLAHARIAATGAMVFQADAGQLPLPDKSFDVVIMSEILEHLDDPVTALREAYRVLRPDGALLVTVPNANYPLAWDPINWLLERAFKTKIRTGTFSGIWANHVRLYSKSMLESHVLAAGFEVEEILHQTRYCLPFIHNLVYGFGKPLLDHGLLPRSWHRSAERASGSTDGQVNRQSLFDPISLARAIVNWFDRSNQRTEPENAPTLTICLRARHP